MAKNKTKENAKTEVTLNKENKSFITACAKGDLKRVKTLWGKGGIKLNSVDKEGKTGFMHAACGGHITVMKFLVDQKVDVNFANSRGWTAITLSVMQGKEKSVVFLVDNGADINVTDILYQTPLIHAAVIGHYGIANYLIMKKADIEAQDEFGRNALMHSVCERKDRLVDLLLRNNSSVDALDVMGDSVLNIGRKNDTSKKIYDNLVKQGATFSNRGSDNEEIADDELTDIDGDERIIIDDEYAGQESTDPDEIIETGDDD